MGPDSGDFGTVDYLGQAKAEDKVILRVYMLGGTARAEDAQGTPTQSHISPSILAYQDKTKA